jgi:DNA-binding transcriptional LysR family regulator
MSLHFDLRELQIFVAAAEELNFTRASERVHISQPALSQRIARLEGRLGVSLFRRGPQGVTLTKAGSDLRDGAERLLAEARQLARQVGAVRRTGESTIRLAYVEYAVQRWIPAIVSAITARHRGMHVEHVEMPAFEIPSALRESRADVGLGLGPIRGRGIEHRPLCRGQWLVVCSTTHSLARVDEVSLHDLAHEPIILFERSLNPRAFDAFGDACRRAGFEPKVALQTRQPTLGLELARQGLGVLAIASYALPDCGPGLEARPLRGLRSRPSLAVAWRREDTSGPVQTTVDAAVRMMR